MANDDDDDDDDDDGVLIYRKVGPFTERVVYIETCVRLWLVNKS